MRRSIWAVLALLMFVAVPQMFADIETLLFLDAGFGSTATITIETGDYVTVNCSGICALTANAAMDHGTLIASGILGTYDINIIGRGGLATIEPTLQNLNQIQVRQTAGVGTLIAEFTDTDYSTLDTAFFLSASIVNDQQIQASTTDFFAYVNSSLIGSFGNLTGPSQATSGSFGNPAGSIGSLTTRTVIDFTGAGAVQASFTIANAIPVAVPEPTSSVVLFGGILLAATGLTLRRKDGK